MSRLFPASSLLHQIPRSDTMKLISMAPKTPDDSLFTRRTMLKSGSSLLALNALGSPVLDPRAGNKKLKVVFVGGHPDDPESAAGGTMALYSGAGHEVVALYLTRGEAGITGKTAEEAAAIRTKEAEAACKILKARPVFAGQIDGDTELNRARYAEFRKLLTAEQPDIVFTHWPIDTHPDHRVASLLVFDAWQSIARARGKIFDLFYHEVMTGRQTQQFTPNVYVDLAEVWQKKREAFFAHRSQNPDKVYAYHQQMEFNRGMECGRERAEAFVAYVMAPGLTAAR